MQAFCLTLACIGLLALAEFSGALVDDLCPCSPEGIRTADGLGYKLAAQLSSPFLVHTASSSPLVFGKAMRGTAAAAGAPEDYGRVSAVLVQPKGKLQFLHSRVIHSLASGPASTYARASYWVRQFGT